MKAYLLIFFFCLNTIMADVVPLQYQDGTEVMLKPSNAQNEFRTVLTTWYSNMKRYISTASTFDDHCMLGFAAFVPAESEDPVKVYTGKKRQNRTEDPERNWQNIDCPPDAHMHTERQLVDHVLRTATEQSSPLFAADALSLGQDPLVGTMYIYVESFPCQTSNHDNGYLSCVQYYNEIAQRFPNVTFHVYFPCNKLTLDPGNILNIPEANIDGLFSLLKSKARKIKKGEEKPFTCEFDHSFQLYQHSRGDPFIFQYLYSHEEGRAARWYDVRKDAATLPLIFTIINCYARDVALKEEKVEERRFALQMFTTLYPVSRNLQYFMTPPFRQRSEDHVSDASESIAVSKKSSSNPLSVTTFKSIATGVTPSNPPSTGATAEGSRLSLPSSHPVGLTPILSENPRINALVPRVDGVLKQAYGEAQIKGETRDYNTWVNSLNLKKVRDHLRKSGLSQKIDDATITEILNKLKGAP